MSISYMPTNFKSISLFEMHKYSLHVALKVKMLEVAVTDDYEV